MVISHGGRKVKRISILGKFSRPILILSLVTLLPACSWVTGRRTLFGEGQEKAGANVNQAPPQAMATVPKSQYDELLKRYEFAMNQQKMDRARTGPVTGQPLASPETSPSSEDPTDLINELSRNNDPAAAETIDVYGQVTAGTSVGLTRSKPIIAIKDVSGIQIEREVKILKLANEFVDMNKFDAALTRVKELENSPIEQIQVRAKFLLGEILFRQGEFDLAMQMYEEIVNEHAFSGIILKTLGRLIVCSEKLKVKSKQEKYYSILHDFFQS